jgi:hypothetical protein
MRELRSKTGIGLEGDVLTLGSEANHLLEDAPPMGTNVNAIRVFGQDACHQNGQRLIIALVAPLLPAA